MTERDIFHAAAEITDLAERSVYLEQACAGDPCLRQQLERMLEVYPQLGTFLESPAVDGVIAASAPVKAGRFEIGQELAQGGMGVVYSARDEALGRDVAVKVLHERYLAGSLFGQRFLDEARITARLQHPGIPPVFEGGRLDDERPYLAMKLIKGRTLDELLKERAQPASDRGRFLAVFEQTCQAVAYAHSKHVLHRDLKPANVMVGAFGEVQVMDWGRAKLLQPGTLAAQEPGAGTQTTYTTAIHSLRQRDSATLVGSVLGTPAYMAPEQAGGKLDRIDERTDVFGLGAILCVILTGEPPYKGKSSAEVQLMAVRGKLADAHARLAQCQADAKLVELCRACLSAEPANRPRDAGAVAATIAGYLAGVEERARQAELERAAALARAAEHRKRRRVELALGATVLVLLGLVGFGLWWRQRVEALAAAVAQSEAERNRRLLYSADVHLASQAWQEEDGTAAQCRELLLAHVPAPGQSDLREFAWRYQWRLLHQGSVVRLPVVPRAAGVAAGDKVVTLDEKGEVNAWPIGDPEKREELALASDGVLGVTLSGNGEVAVVIDRDGSPRVLDAGTGRQEVQIRVQSALVNAHLSADGRFLAGVGRDKHARVWDAKSGQELFDYPMIDPTARYIDLSPDGKQLLALSGAKRTLVVTYRAGKEPIVLSNEEDSAAGGFTALHGALSRDGKLAAVAYAGSYVDLYNTTTGKLVQILPSRTTPAQITFSPDGNQLAVGESTGLVTLWRLPRPVLAADQRTAASERVQGALAQPHARNLKGHQAAIIALAFSRDGQKLVSIGRDKMARSWDVGEQEESRVLRKGAGQIDALNYSPDGRYLVEASMNDGIRLHDLTSAVPPRTLTTRISRRAVFSPDGRTIAGGPDHRLTLWDVKTGAVLGTLAEAEPAEIGALVFSPDGRWLAVGVGGPHNFNDDAPQKVMVFDVAHRKKHRTFATPTQVSAVAFSADGKLLSAAGHDGTIWLWDTSSWNEISRWRGPGGAEYACILFVPGDRLGEAGRLDDLLATGSTSGTIDMWNVRTQALARQIHGHIDCVTVMALSPDGRTLATGSWDRSIKLWDSGTGRELRTLHREGAWVYALAFSPDGNALATGGLSAVLRLWEAASKETVAADLAELDMQRESGTRPILRSRASSPTSELREANLSGFPSRQMRRIQNP